MRRAAAQPAPCTERGSCCHGGFAAAAAATPHPHARSRFGLRRPLGLRAIAGTGRQTGLPITVDGVTLPPGTEIGIALQAMHTHPDHFSRPNEFCPERWLPADHELASDATANPRAFLPFLSGPRKCAGQQLAEMEHTVGVHAVLDRFDVTVSDRPRPAMRAICSAPADSRSRCSESALRVRRRWRPGTALTLPCCLLLRPAQSPVTSLRMRADLYSSIESPVAFTCAPRATE